MRAGQFRPAIDLLRKLVQAQPKNAQAINLLGRAHTSVGELAQGEHHFDRAVALAPHVAALWNDLGSCRIGLNKPADAARALEHAVKLDPNLAVAWAGLSSALAMLRRYDESVEAGHRCIQTGPQLPYGYQNTAMSLIESGRCEEAAQVATLGHQRLPAFYPTLSTLLQATHYISHDPAQLHALHRRFGELYRGVPLPPAITPLIPDRPLRIGILSADLRQHSVAHFAEPIITHRDRSQFALHLYYSGHTEPDAVSQRLRTAADHWTPVTTLDDATLDRRIRSDAIDILIELNGHTAGNRLTALLSKPAPLIITAIGYPNTTGIPAIDLRLVDPITDPPGSESLLTERPLRLDPCFLCYTPPSFAPPVSPLPDGPPTFVSFNALAKISTTTCELWAAVLRAAPDARLLVKCATGLSEPAVANRLRQRLVNAGVDATRLELLPATGGLDAHLATYARASVALDTFPYHGTTTTCEALWMGIPTVTLQGQSHVSRVGPSLLRAAGLPNLIAESPTHYAQIAATLIADRAALSKLRSELRARLATSPLCDAPAYATKFWTNIREAWRTRCTRA